MICIACRGTAAIAALILANTDGEQTLYSFAFTNETVATAVPQALAMLGIPGDAHIHVNVVAWNVPSSILDAHVVSHFAAAVQANDVAYFYGITNSKGGQA